jgi:hypothetical protein
MTNTGGPTTPAGWFTDPGGSGHLRWWDGNAWTAHLAPQPTPAPTPVVPQPTVLQPVVLQPVVQQQQAQYTPVEQQPVALAADNQPYVPFQGSWNAQSYNTGYAADTGDFARPAQWNTVGSWLLAFSGILLGGALLIALSRGALPTTPYGLGAILGSLAVPYLITLVFAEVDRRKLRSLGYVKIPSLWWMLLSPPLVYLIVRTVYVWGEVRKGAAPLVTYIVVSVVSGIGVSLAVSLLFAASLTNTSQQFASSLQTGLNEKGGHFTVSCPAIIPTTIGSTFSCTAVDSTGTSHVLSIQVVTGADGKPGVKLQSVTPPISG